jgi:hypothetical protein
MISVSALRSWADQNHSVTLFVQQDVIMVLLAHQTPLNATPAKVFAGVGAHARSRGWWTADAKANESKNPGAGV